MKKVKSSEQPNVRRWHELAREVRQQRQASGLSQQQLAEQIGASQALISQVENGSSISVLNLQRLSEWLGADTSALVESQESSQGVLWAYCGDTYCASLSLAANEGVLFIAPTFERFSILHFETCRYCNGPFMRECPECQEPIRERRLVCGECGHRYVEVPASLVGLSTRELEREANAWDERNRRIRERIENSL